jgi:hypothetical protein
LAKVEPTSPNTLIAFAAKAGSTASDGDGKNSPFTAALVKHLPKPGLDLRRAFGFARDDVLKATNNRQEPYVYGSLGGDDVALVPAPTVVTPPVTSASDPDLAIRRAYEFAERVGTRAVWDSFIKNYPFGFYTDLARAQRDKVGADMPSVALAEKSKASADEQKRLAPEEVKTAEAERARIASQAKSEGDTTIVADKAKLGQLAALAPPQQPGDAISKSSATDIPRLLLAELLRVGCHTSAIDGIWNTAAQRSLGLFNKNAGTKFDVKAASFDALDAVRSKTERICPLICEHGYKADGESCTKINCRAGYGVGDDNTCEKVETKKPNRKPCPIRSRNAPHQSRRQPSLRNQVKFYAIKVAADQSKEVVDSPITYMAILSEKSATDWAYHAARSSTIRAACFPVLAPTGYGVMSGT